MLRVRATVTAILFGILLTVGSGVAAEDVLVDYINGDLALRSGSGWIDLAPGTTVTSTSIVRLGEFSVAELSAADTKILLSQQGPIDLSTVLALVRKSPARNVFTKVGTTISELLVGSESGPATSGGLRSERDGGTVSGVRSFSKSAPGLDSLNFLEASDTPGFDLLAARKYKEAGDQFLTAAGNAEGTERARLTYFAAYARAADGNEADALRLMLQIRDDESLIGDAGYVLLKGSLLMESTRFLDAIQLFARYTASLDGKPPVPEVRALAELSQKALDK
ncbi:MAG TPA: hypothetical protein VMW87_14005 [Spirochaetia bacterium]|nr:hypothetical protein [Spirochaetia bacterium]